MRDLVAFQLIWLTLERTLKEGLMRFVWKGDDCVQSNIIITGKTSVGYRARKSIQALVGSIFPNEYVTKMYYRVKMKERLNLKSPRTFNEKIQWYKLNYCANNDLVVQCSDKFAVRKYVRECGYGHSLNGLVGVWDSVDEIEWDSLPEKFVLKCNHGCGYNIICRDKSKLNIKKVTAILRRWMKEDFGLYNVEPHYNKINKKILCEEFIETSDQKLPNDYKIFCFDGVPKMVGVYVDRDTAARGMFFDLEWNLMNVSHKEPVFHIPKPKLLDDAITMSKRLSSAFPFVRVDLYDCENTIIFGELTFSPAAGFSLSFSAEGDARLGELFRLPM